MIDRSIANCKLAIANRKFGDDAKPFCELHFAMANLQFVNPVTGGIATRDDLD
jgi:hypothetical protein